MSDLSPMQRSRIKKAACVAVEDVCRKSAPSLNVPLPDLTTEVFQSLLSHPICKNHVERKCEEAVSRSLPGMVRASLTSVWANLSAPRVVGSNHAFPLRRAICAAVAGPGVSFPVARDFLGGLLKRETFKSAKRRHEDFMRETPGSSELL